MQKVKLPKQVDPFKSAAKRSDYEGIMLAKDMQRLSEAVGEVLEDVRIYVKFDTDAQGLTYFDGKLKTKVSLICQRCNDPFIHEIDSCFCFCPVRAGEDMIDELPEKYDPVEVDEYGELDLLSLFEDELIISLPIVAMHPESNCRVGESDMKFGEIEQEEAKPNPFAVLEKLKRNQE